MNEATPHLIKKSGADGRGWQPLFDILNQTLAFGYLKRSHCTGVEFVPRSTKRGVETPDLRGSLNGMNVFCEVKTVNISDNEAMVRGELVARAVANALEDGFVSKLASDTHKSTIGSVTTHNLESTLF